MRYFRNFNRDSFSQGLNQIDWQLIIANNNNDIDIILSAFCSKFNEILNTHASIKKNSRRQ